MRDNLESFCFIYFIYLKGLSDKGTDFIKSDARERKNNVLTDLA